MHRSPASRLPRLVPALTTVMLLGVPGPAHASVSVFGSPLTATASRDTAQNLNYPGINAIQNGTGVTIHNDHDGADTALWNARMPRQASAGATAGGQIVSIRLKGCAEPASGGPAPLTQIHFQSLTPLSGGGARVDVTSQPFTIPTCGVHRASPNTVTSYLPTNMCVNRGDIVDFNDEGGFDPNYYPSGVRYRVIGSVSGAAMDSFIANNGTNNGASMIPAVVAPTSGFAANQHEELLLQSTLGTGINATPLCPGGLRGAPGEPGGKAALAFGQTTIGANHSGEVRLGIYCALVGRPCSGTITLRSGSHTIASTHITAPTGVVTVVTVKLSTALMAQLRSQGPIPVTATARLSGAVPVSRPMHLRI